MSEENSQPVRWADQNRPDLMSKLRTLGTCTLPAKNCTTSLGNIFWHLITRVAQFFLLISNQNFPWQLTSFISHQSSVHLWEKSRSIYTVSSSQAVVKSKHRLTKATYLKWLFFWFASDFSLIGRKYWAIIN